MCRTFHLFIGVLCLSLCSAAFGAGLVQDSFDGAALDPNNWQVLNSGNASVVQENGQVKFNRPTAQLNYLLTAKQFDPAVTPLLITGSVTLGPDADMDIWTRAGNTGNTGGGPGHVLDCGTRVNFWRDAVASGYPPVLDILEKTAGVWPWNSSISDGVNITGNAQAIDWSFVVTDDGTTITATFTQTSDPTNTLTLTGTSTTKFAKNYIALTVVNGTLNDVTISRLILMDGFDAALDPNDWQTLNSGNASVVQENGQVKFNRPTAQLNYLLTAKQFDPAATPLTIAGTVTLGPDADMDIWTRAGNTGNTGGGPGHVLDCGVRVNFWRDAVASGYPPVLDILEKTAGVWPWNSSISDGVNITGNAQAIDWSFVVTDDGTTITATFTQTSDPTNTLTLTGTSTTKFAKNYIALTVVNGWLNDVTITTSKATTDFKDSFDTPYNYLTDGLGAYSGKLNGTIQALDASTTRPGALYFATANGVWEPGPGPLLYVTVSGDFVATVKVVDFAGTLAAPVFHNDAGIMARNPASDGGLENWVGMSYFPTWTAFVARTITDGVKGDGSELGQPAGSWAGTDTFALAAQYPYIQLERKGSNFHFRISADGVSFLPLTVETFAGIYTGTQTPLVVSRPDLPTTLQVGLFNATYSDAVGYAAFDDFSIIGR